jgi:hypothetical protein
MRFRYMAAIPTLCLALLAGCSKSNDLASADRRLTKFVESEPALSTASWLEKQSNLSGEWDRISLVYGYTDDYAACVEIATALANHLSPNVYRCIPQARNQ